MKRILVLFAKDWDRLEFSRPEYRGRYEFIHEGFDLFSFPGNARLLSFDVFAYINRLAQRFRRERIDGIVSNNEQFGAVIAAVLAEKLGLPGNDPRAVITAQHKSESAWTDTIIEMRNRGANGSDEDMEQIIHYLATNYGPPSAATKVNVNTAVAADLVAGLALSPAQADAVVAYRAKNGKFADLAGLKQVAGVDAAKIDAVKDRIEF